MSDNGEAYLDIVWRQFKKNRAALISLWALAPLMLVGIFAPMIASNQPLVYYDGQRWMSPWIAELFNPRETVDFVFNMAMVGFVPWVVLAAALNAKWKQRDMPGRRRVLLSMAIYVAVIVLTTGIFLIPGVAPSNPYRGRTFVVEQFQSPQTHRGWYAPIPFGPTEQDINAHFEPPLYQKPKDERTKANDFFIHLLGTDDTGRDVLVQLIYGLRISMTVGFVAVGIYVTIGVILGAIAGYFGGRTDMVISRAIEIVLLFPSFFLILTLVGLIGPSIYLIMVVIGVTSWPTVARLIRGEVLKQRAIDYTAAARALGASHGRIIFRHILPNAISPVMVAVPFGIASAIVLEAGLALLGFGVQPPTPSWGSLLRLGHDNYEYWWLIVWPSLAIFFTVTVFNLVGGGLRDAMDPRLRA